MLSLQQLRPLLTLVFTVHSDYTSTAWVVADALKEAFPEEDWYRHGTEFAKQGLGKLNAADVRRVFAHTPRTTPDQTHEYENVKVLLVRSDSVPDMVTNIVTCPRCEYRAVQPTLEGRLHCKNCVSYFKIKSSC